MRQFVGTPRIGLWIGLALTAAMATACGLGGGGSPSVTEHPFERPLPIPPLDRGTRHPGGTTEYTLEARSGQADFGQGGTAQTIGYNGGYLGPTLLMRQGESVRVHLKNSLDEMTTLHWHGMHLPAQMDGGPHQMIRARGAWSPTWQVRQPAATLWYHSHPHGETAQQVYRGLAGMLIIDDPGAPDVGLPHSYGVDDIPLIVQDKSFTPTGDLVVDPVGVSSTGFLGDTIVTNGSVGDFLPVTTEAVRLRVLNGSNARVYNFGFDDGREFAVVASDGGLLPAPVTTDRLQLSPGERAELVVRPAPAQTLTLTSSPPDLGSGGDSRFGTGTFPVLQLRAAATLRPSPALSPTLTTLPAADESAAVRTRTFGITGRAINGRPTDLHRIDEVVPVDQAEIWEITNQDPQPHNFHVHDGQFRVLSTAGAAPAPVLAGLKDTVYVAPRTTVRILVRFSDYTDPTRPYMFHCHLLLHEDLGVMGQFVVVKPGQRAAMSN